VRYEDIANIFISIAETGSRFYWKDEIIGNFSTTFWAYHCHRWV